MGKIYNLIRDFLKRKNSNKVGTSIQKSELRASVNKKKLFLKHKPQRPQPLDRVHGRLNQQADASSCANLLDETKSEQIFKQKSQLFNKNNSKFKSNESIRSDIYTLEQMYNDNSIYNQFETSQFRQQSTHNSRDSSITSESSNDKTFLQTTSTSGDIGALLNSVSISKLDEEIKYRVLNLKQFSVQFNIQTPIQISMLESLYQLKMGQIKQEASVSLKEFDERVAIEKENEKRNLNRLFSKISATRNFLKNYGLRRRSKSVEGSKKIGLDKTVEEQNNNYYLFERETLERKYENRIRAMQFEILNSIHDIEVQLHEILRQKVIIEEEMIKKKGSKCQRHRCKHQSRQRHHHRQNENKSEVVHVQNERQVTRKQRLNYSTEVSMQKRIRNRKQSKEVDQLRQPSKRSNSTF